MMEIPTWILTHFEKSNFSCPSCRDDFNTKGCNMLGIKSKDAEQHSHKQDKRHVLYMEYECPRCKSKVGFEIIDMTLEEFASSILEDMENEAAIEAQKEMDKRSQEPEKEVPVKQSRISAEEQSSAIDMLNQSITWQDWLIKIGADLNPQYDD